MSVVGFSSSSSLSVFIAVLVLVLNGVEVCNGGKTSEFVRKAEKTVDMPLDSDVFAVPPGYNAPQQVHITQGDHEGRAVIISWITANRAGSNKVSYWSEKSYRKKQAFGKVYTYKFYNYTSGFIHHCTIENLKFNTKYYYEVRIGNCPRTFWFVTPPKPGPDVPYTFGVIDEARPSLSSRVLAVITSLIKASQSIAPFWYSIKRGPAYIIVLSPYSAYGHFTPQYFWLAEELSKVNRRETPWLIVLMHTPWYNSYNARYMEGESMRVIYESCMTEPQPEYSAFREASFGHAIIDIKNRTHAYYSWSRNEEGYAVEADSLWFHNRHWYPVDKLSPTLFGFTTDTGTRQVVG